MAGALSSSSDSSVWKLAPPFLSGITFNDGRDLTTVFVDAGAAALLGRGHGGNLAGGAGGRLASSLELLKMLPVARVMLASVRRSEE